MKKRFFFLVFLSVELALNAQPFIFTKQWDKRFGGSSIDDLWAIQQTTDNGFIIGGGSDSPISGDKTTSNLGIGDFWVVKTDANGNKQWDRRYGGIS